MQTPLADRLKALLDALEIGLVERRQCLRLCLLAALAGEHTLLVGPPGTAKSELARRLHTAFAQGHYFERLLTRFTVPEELFGPLSIRALEQDRYERQTTGYLPTASIAFIDEVFKANSAILNALLTLLNEREFDNGAGRTRCPLISVVGASNEVPADEVSEAFIDRFLLRIPVAPVSADGFAALLGRESATPWVPPATALQLHAAELQQLAQAASQLALPSPVVDVLLALRAHLGAQGVYVSDRRWVQMVALLRMAAASEGRAGVALWDLMLLPWLCATDAAGQAAVADWLASQLGVAQATSPARIATAVEAFERQLNNERNANDLDYDESGRLQFTATDIADAIGDAKGSAGAMRMHYSRKRRYGQTHIDARLQQLDALAQRIGSCLDEVRALQSDLADYQATSLWLEPHALARALHHLQRTQASVEDLAQRVDTLRSGFEDLPRLSPDNGVRPEPVALEALDSA